ncbi:helix-turn-helix transcriptional regulator [Paracoccus marinaquae]|uniref:Helix-turn-helix transcriptional regulator n=1 Tax=Paracoccus marinaquae TaxID=2841926 RepID=A0ABS6AKA4_9RHOB|nr:helix-turn-helix transcriptional regulator [Paracoccus marinaquae]MBU3031025.1 helix-turn-helix transcriptional regulator [Paracoccus marinaquae]
MPEPRKSQNLGIARIRCVVAELSASGVPSLASVAERLSASPRTVQRRLAEHGLCFRRVVEDARLGMACVFLERSELGIEQIARQIGYNSSSAFARAFGRWAGVTPKTYRRAAGRPRPDPECLA